MEFSERLRELRIGKGYSLRDLADMCNTSKSAINMYERGERKPKHEVLEAIAEAFDVDMDYLLGKTNIPKRRGFKIGERIQQSISHNIRHYREQENLSQKQFADLLGVEESMVVALESGQSVLEKDMLYKICDTLYLIPSNIIPRDDEELDDDTVYLLSRRDKKISNKPEQNKGSTGIGELTGKEVDLIIKYREKEHLQAAVDKLLDV